jgi:formate dehydrogenase maturation protein FdhE
MSNPGSETMAVDTAAMEARLAGLVGNAQVADDYVRFRLNLVHAQGAALEAISGAAPAFSPELDASRGSPWLKLAAVPIDNGILRAYFDSLFIAVKEHGQAEFMNLDRAATADPTLLETFTRRGGIEPDDAYLAALGQQLGAHPQALRSVAHILAAPFVGAAVTAIMGSTGVDTEAQDTHGKCPYCGAPPALTRLKGEEGKRVVYCSLCGVDRPAPRMQCPFCGNLDQAKLGVLFVGEDRARFIEVCEQCHCYIKCYDDRQLTADYSPFVEETATLYMDILAEEEGYSHRLPYAALR